MDKVLKQRLIGASILIALAVIFIPMFFDAPQDERESRQMTIDLPEPPADRAQVRRMPLDPDLARRPPPETQAEPESALAEEAVSGDDDLTAGIEALAEVESVPDPVRQEEAVEALPEEAPVPEPVTDPEPAQPAEAMTQPEPEPPAVEASEALVAAETSSSDGWIVQVASFGSMDTASDIVERLTSLGHVAGIDSLVRGEMTLYRVLTGPYPSREDADRARGQIARTLAGVEPIVRAGSVPAGSDVPGLSTYAIQLGSFASRNNAVRLVEQLEDMDFAAFIHEDQTGSRTIWRVRMGPFADRAEAERKLAEVGERARLEGLVVSHP
jgi:DedD protein